MRSKDSKLANVLRAMDAFITPAQPAKPAQLVSVPEPDEYGYWTRRPDGGLHYHAYDPATEDDEDELADHLIDGGDIPEPETCDRCGKMIEPCSTACYLYYADATGGTATMHEACMAMETVRPFRLLTSDDLVEQGMQVVDRLLTQLPTPVTCHLCGAVVEGDALAVQTAADGSAKLDNWYCRAHLVAGTERLKAAIRTQREGDA